MKADIKLKLTDELAKDINTEIQVVYILSRIRKILEIDSKKEDYKVLNFYCNWCLHNKINDVRPVESVIKEFITDPIGDHGFLDFVPFDKEFKRFLKEYEINTNIYSSVQKEHIFKNILVQIYSDTPLIVESEARKIVILDGNIKELHSFYGVSFKIESL